MGFINTVATELRKLEPGTKQLRNFGLLFWVAFSLIGIYMIWKGSGTGYYLIAFGLLSAAAGLVRPQILRPVYKVWMTLAVALGTIVSPLILAAIYYLVVTPVGIAARVAGKDFLHTRLRGDSYWHEVSADEAEPGRAEKMY